MKLNYETPIVIVTIFADTVKLDDSEDPSVPAVTLPDDFFGDE